MSPASGGTRTIHDRFGVMPKACQQKVIAETSAATVVREYVWLPQGAATGVDLPVAVIDNVNTTPVTYYVHADHLGRPIAMTNAAKAFVWQATWQPWGGVQAITGTASLNARFPGQWFQIESGLHYNWHRHYDASIGRYTQPDPLGFVDGPSVYGYASGTPTEAVDPDGQRSTLLDLAVKLCRSNPNCGGGLTKLESFVKKCECKIEKHGPHHNFKGLGYCEHYQLTCHVPGIKKSTLTYQWALPGRCYSTSKGGPPSLDLPTGPPPPLP